jgi:hypothetical protein
MAARVFFGVLALLVMGIVVSSCGTLESGNVGIRTTLGKVSSEEL